MPFGSLTDIARTLVDVHPECFFSRPECDAERVRETLAFGMDLIGSAVFGGADDAARELRWAIAQAAGLDEHTQQIAKSLSDWFDNVRSR